MGDVRCAGRPQAGNGLRTISCNVRLSLSLFLGAAGQAIPPKGSTLDDKIQQRVQALKARGTSKYTPEVQGSPTTPAFAVLLLLLLPLHPQLHSLVKLSQTVFN